MTAVNKTDDVRRKFYFPFPKGPGSAFRSQYFTVEFERMPPKRDEDDVTLTDEEFAVQVALAHFGSQWCDPVPAEAVGPFPPLLEIIVESDTGHAKCVGSYSLRPTRSAGEAIAPHIKEALDQYAASGREVGDFLQAVLANDFTGAVCRADSTNIAAIVDIAKYVYNDMPSQCHGSREAYKNWIEAKRTWRPA